MVQEVVGGGNNTLLIPSEGVSLVPQLVPIREISSGSSRTK